MADPAAMPTGSLAAGMTDGETAAALYLAEVSLWSDAPEVPSIGARGPRSRELTRDMVFHMHLTGRLGKPRRSPWQWLRGLPARLWRRWEISCAPEPWPERKTRPSLFPPRDSHDDD